MNIAAAGSSGLASVESLFDSRCRRTSTRLPRDAEIITQMPRLARADQPSLSASTEQLEHWY